jgi:hypothetical protein
MVPPFVAGCPGSLPEPSQTGSNSRLHEILHRSNRATTGQSEAQNTYIDAVQTLQDVNLCLGHYLVTPRECRRCGFIYDAPQEKMTDVNIAVELLGDAFQDVFDTALLISADSDLIAPITAIKKLFPNKRVIVACPPGRFSQNLTKGGSRFFEDRPWLR